MREINIDKAYKLLAALTILNRCPGYTYKELGTVQSTHCIGSGNNRLSHSQCRNCWRDVLQSPKASTLLPVSLIKILNEARHLLVYCPTKYRFPLSDGECFGTASVVCSPHASCSDCWKLQLRNFIAAYRRG
jgi:hypothetical protein